MNGKYLWVLLAMAFAIRIAAGWWWQSRLPADARFGFADSESYWVLAQAIATGQPYQMDPQRRVFRTPGYPALLAPMLWMGGDTTPVIWARALNAVFGTAAVGAVLGLTRLLFDPQAAKLAGLATAVSPCAVAMSTFVLAEGPFCPLMMVQIILWVLAASAASDRRAAVAGLAGGAAAGLATLVRPSWLLFTPFAAGLAICFARRRWRQALVGGCMLAGLALAMSPWWIRNWQLTGAFIPTTLQVGESLYDGLHAGATGASDMRFVDEFRRQLQTEDAAAPWSAELAATFEQRLDRRMRDAAIVWAKTHPGDAARLAVVKFARTWNVWPNEPSLRNGWLRLAVMTGYLPLLIGGIIGAWWFRDRGWSCALCILPAVYFAGLHMIFVGSIRYRQPAMLPLTVLAAGVAAELLRSWRRQATSPEPPA